MIMERTYLFILKKTIYEMFRLFLLLDIYNLKFFKLIQKIDGFRKKLVIKYK